MTHRARCTPLRRRWRRVVGLRRRAGARSPVDRAGFTLVEILVVMTIIGVLTAIALPSYAQVRERAQVAAAITELRALQQEITEFFLTNERFPSDLAELGRAGDRDPWGFPYVYLNHEGATAAAKRKDRFLVPVNSDYDLYSVGPDGLSTAAFSAAASRDDVVRANNGGYIGLAELF